MRLADRVLGRFVPTAALRLSTQLAERGDTRGAFTALTRAAQAGIPEAEYRMGRAYLEGAGVPPGQARRGFDIPGR